MTVRWLYMGKQSDHRHWCCSWNIKINVAPGTIIATDQSHFYHVIALQTQRKTRKINTWENWFGVFRPKPFLPKPKQTDRKLQK